MKSWLRRGWHKFTGAGWLSKLTIVALAAIAIGSFAVGIVEATVGLGNEKTVVGRPKTDRETDRATPITVESSRSTLRQTGPQTATPSAAQDTENAKAIVREFYERLAQFDTAGMVAISCADTAEGVETGVSMLQGLFGVGAYLRLGSPKMAIEDYQSEVVSSSSTEVDVHATFRLLAGAPYGSVDMDEVLTVRHEGGDLCVSDKEYAARHASPVPSTPGQRVCSILSVGCSATVTNVSPENLFVRTAPGKSAGVAGRLPQGEIVCLTGSATQADGFTWWPVRPNSLASGWSAQADPAAPGTQWLTPTGQSC